MQVVKFLQLSVNKAINDAICAPVVTHLTEQWVGITLHVLNIQLHLKTAASLYGVGYSHVWLQKIISDASLYMWRRKEDIIQQDAAHAYPSLSPEICFSQRRILLCNSLGIFSQDVPKQQP